MWRWLVLLVGCGRIAFDPLADARAVSGPDATVPDRVLLLPFNNTFDDQGNGRTGTCDPSCPTFAPGHDGLGARFDGTACLRYDDIAAYDTGTFTIGVWSDATAYMQGTFISKPYAPATNDTDSYQLWSNNNLTIQFQTNAGANNEGIEATKVTAPWHLVVATFDGTTKRLYIDAVEQASANLAAPIVFDGSAIRIGCDEDFGSVNTQITGVIDDVIIYTRALSPAEITAFYAM